MVTISDKKKAKEKAVDKFTVDELLRDTELKLRPDLLKAILDNTKRYSKDEAIKEMDKFLKRGVR